VWLSLPRLMLQLELCCCSCMVPTLYCVTSVHTLRRVWDWQVWFICFWKSLEEECCCRNRLLSLLCCWYLLLPQ
jgi:hypothetical protein